MKRPFSSRSSLQMDARKSSAHLCGRHKPDEVSQQNWIPYRAVGERCKMVVGPEEKKGNNPRKWWRVGAIRTNQVECP